MNVNSNKSILPTKLKYILLVSFCLMTLIPMLAGAYVSSIVMKDIPEKGGSLVFSASVIALLSLLIAYLGFITARQLLMPLIQVKNAARNIAEGRLGTEPPVVTSADEIQDLTRSLHAISHNARELLEKVERLSLRDKLTGLYNSTYIRERLSEEIQRAIHYQRPCSFVFLVIRGFEEFASDRDSMKVEEGIKQIALTLNKHLFEFDRAARIGRDEFVIIYPDKSKKKCIEIVERICRDVEALGLKAPGGDVLSLSAGISENPIDGVDADNLYIKAQDRVKTAQAQGKPLEAFI